MEALTPGGEDMYEFDEEMKDDDSDDLQHVNCFDIEEDIYGMCITSLVIDLQRLAKGSQTPTLRFGRIILTCGLLVGVIALQAWLLYCVRKYVSAVAVKEIRSSYSAYEAIMHPNGMDQPFDAAKFTQLGPEIKDLICQIPFSQPYFFMTILGLWTVSILSELKDVWFMGRCTVGLETAPGYTHMTEMFEEGQVIMRLPRPLKAFIFCLVLVPRVVIALILLWLGCRWLSATPNFSDLILNAVALVFIAELRTLMFDRLTPARGKRDLRQTKFLAMETDTPTFCNLLGAYGWLVFVFVFVVIYVYELQQVLPNYRWDVQAVCEEYIGSMSR
jgi:hypothetical protein